MTVRELIEDLQRLPENRSVVVDYAGIASRVDGGDVDRDGYTDVLYAGFSEIERNGADQEVAAIVVGLE